MDCPVFGCWNNMAIFNKSGKSTYNAGRSISFCFYRFSNFAVFCHSDSSRVSYSPFGGTRFITKNIFGLPTSKTRLSSSDVISAVMAWFCFEFLKAFNFATPTAVKRNSTLYFVWFNIKCLFACIAGSFWRRSFDASGHFKPQIIENELSLVLR
jgi:hypothetical protein